MSSNSGSSVLRVRAAPSFIIVGLIARALPLSSWRIPSPCRTQPSATINGIPAFRKSVAASKAALLVAVVIFVAPPGVRSWQCIMNIYFCLPWLNPPKFPLCWLYGNCIEFVSVTGLRRVGDTPNSPASQAQPEGVGYVWGDNRHKIKTPPQLGPEGVGLGQSSQITQEQPPAIEQPSDVR